MPGGLKPEAEPLLAGYDPSKFFHLSHSLRPPIGIYRMSLMRIWPRFESLLIEVWNVLREKQYLQPSVAWGDEMLEAYEQLLYSLFEHLDDCDNILKCCFPRGQRLAQNPHFREYKREIEPYRDSIGRIVNQMKHNQGRLRSIVFYGDEWASPGYFVETVYPDGAIGPDPRIHPGGKTAFSCARDMRHHFAWLYVISRNLAKAVSAIMGSPTEVILESPSEDDKIAEVAGRLSMLPRIVFPDEEQKGYPAIDYRQGKQEREILMVLLPPYLGPLPPPLTFRVSFSYRGDGVSNAFIRPYAGDLPPTRA